jgi:hypothetical protein
MDGVRSLRVGRVRGQDFENSIRQAYLFAAAMRCGCGHTSDPIPYVIVDVPRKDPRNRGVIDLLQFDDPTIGSSAFDASLEGLGEEGLVKAGR